MVFSTDKIRIMNLKLETADNLFMSYEFGTLFGLIRVSKEANYIFSIYNKEKGNGCFKEFMRFVEESSKPTIILNVRNSRLWHHLRHNGYQPYNGEVVGTNLNFVQSLIKNKSND